MGTRKAVVIGINDYPNGARLHGAVRDATAVSDILRRNGDGTVNFHVELHTNVRTTEELTSLADRLFSGNNEICLFYFSGHGYVNDLDTFLVAPDSQRFTGGLSFTHLLEMARKNGSENKVFILDCCHSGGIGNIPLLGSGASVIHQGVTILSASKADELSWEVNGTGVFTNLLLRALEGGASDIQGNITPGGIYSYIDSALGPFDQRPVFKTNITTFTSLRKVTPLVSLDALHKITTYFPDPQKDHSLDPSYEFTNSVEEQHVLLKPYADAGNVAVFKDLQKFASLGLVVPVDADYMYFAAMMSKSCRLTPLGLHYWTLVNRNII